jgi:hypothetical protein
MNRQNYMGAPHTRREREIAKELGVSDAGLKTLLRISRGDPVTGGVAGDKLCAQGLIEEANTVAADGYPWSARRRLTATGGALLKRAREMGY